VSFTHGKLRADRSFWQGSDGRLDDVDIAAIDPAPSSGFFIEAWRHLTVMRSRFYDMPRAVAIDFSFGGDGVVTQSTFTRTRVGLSVHGGSGVTIRDSVFRSDDFGINLSNEDDGGVNDTTVAGNTITESTRDDSTLFFDEPVDGTSFRNTRIAHNRMSHNGGSGIGLMWGCSCVTWPVAERSIVVEGNDLSNNGETSSPRTARLLAPQGAADPSTPKLSHADLDATTAAGAPVAATDEATPDASVPLSPSGDGITARIVTADDTARVLSGLAIIELTKNTTSHDADRGIDALGVTDGDRNVSRHDHDPEPCLGVVCRIAR